jgi:hypothetical protein
MEVVALPASVSASRGGDGGLRSCTGTTGSGLLGLGAADFVPSGGLLVPGAVDFTIPPSHLDLAARVPDPSKRPMLPRRVLAILFHHFRYNNSNIPPVRKNLHLTS